MNAIAPSTRYEVLPEELTAFRQLPNQGNFVDHRWTEMSRELFWHHFNAAPAEVYFMNSMSLQGADDVRAAKQWLENNAERSYEPETMTFNEPLQGYMAETQKYKLGDNYYLHVQDHAGEYIYRAPYRELQQELEAKQQAEVLLASIVGNNKNDAVAEAAPVLEAPTSQSLLEQLTAAGFEPRKLAGWEVLERKQDGKRQRIKWGDAPRGVDIETANKFQLIDITSNGPGALPDMDEKQIDSPEELLAELGLFQRPQLDNHVSHGPQL